MALHEGQLSLLELDLGPIEPLTTEPSNGSPTDSTRHDDAAEIVEPATPCSKGEPGGCSATSLDRLVTTDTEESHRVANRRPRGSPRYETRARSEILEKHYKTREVAELLSVHEETVLRLAQCGSLRSVRVGSERRYPESAIVAFLERNTDQTARKLRVAGRRA
jgi:excisionase family DNA binding protein